MRTGIRFFCQTLVFFLIPVFLSAESGEALNLERVTRFLGDNSIFFERRSLYDDFGGAGTSIHAWKRAADIDAEGTFVLAVPLSADFAVETGLAFASELRNRTNSVNVLVAFLGDENAAAEFGADSGGLSHKGLRDLLALNDMPENWALCYMDIAENPGEIVIQHGSSGYLAPLDIIEPLVSLFAERDMPLSFRIRYNIIYKLGLAGGPEPLLIAWGDEVNGFVLSGREGKSASLNVGEPFVPRDLALLFVDYAESLDLPILTADRHYSSLVIPGGRIIFISGMHTLVLLLAMTVIFLSGFLIYSARHYARLYYTIRLFMGHFWIFFVSLIFLTICIRLSGFLYSLLLAAGKAVLPGYAGLGLTALLAALFFYLPSPALDLVQLPKRAQMYGISAVIFITAGLYLTVFIDFSYVLFFLWAFFFVFLGASVSAPVPVFLCAILVPFFAAGTLLNIFETGYVKIIEKYVSQGMNAGNWRIAFMTALIALPVFLLVKRGAILIQKSANRGLEKKPNRKYRLIVVPVLIAAVFGTMVLHTMLIAR